MSSNRIRSTSVDGKSQAYIASAIQHKKSLKYSLFRPPKSPQEKILSFVVCILLVVVTVFITSLWIMCDRWKATLSQLKHIYIEEDEVCETEACKETAESIISSIDPYTDPCTDFYQYACGGWMQKNPIPDGRSIILVNEQRNREIQKQIFGLLKKHAKQDTCKSVRNAGKLLEACMNKSDRNWKGIKSLYKLIMEFGGWPMLGNKNWSEEGYVWYEHAAKVNRGLYLEIFVDFEFNPNVYDNSMYILTLESGFFRFDYGLDHNFTSDVHKIAARDYIMRAARLLGSTLDLTELLEQAEEVLELEQKLYEEVNRFSQSMIKAVTKIEASFDNSDDDIDMTVGYLQANVTDDAFSYRDFINLHLKSDVLVEDDTDIYVFTPNYFWSLPSIIAETKARTVANYIAFFIFDHFANVASDDARNLSVNYDTKVGTGRSTSVEKVCLYWTKTLMPMAVGRLYVQHYFPERTKMHVKKMLEMISLAYSANIDQNDWMDERTLLYSVIKLQSIQSMILYEDWIMNDELLDASYSKLGEVKKDDFFSAVRILHEIQADDLFSHWNRTAYRNDTDMEMANPTIVNAFYSPSDNFIALPSGIFGYPYYKYGRIDSINYGGIGTVIGHEISHAFDTSGRKYDHNGNLRNWWTNETKHKFFDKAVCFVEQYSNFTDPLSPLKTDGKHTLQENIADNGGVKSAFQAFRLHLALSGENLSYRKRLPGLSASPEQLFFLGYAAVWCGNMTDDYAARYAEYDNHCPNKIRVNVPLSNFKEFAKAFKCKAGTPMNPLHKCSLW